MLQPLTVTYRSAPVIPLLYKFKGKDVEETVPVNMSTSHVQNILLINEHLILCVPYKDAQGKL